jgi:hypothetical protein
VERAHRQSDRAEHAAWQRPPAEIAFADELAALGRTDTDPPPSGSSPSLRVAKRFILGGADAEANIVCEPALIARAMAALRIFATALLASGMLSAPALGNDIKSSLKAFGLIGTWSPDCSKEISQPRAVRFVFAAPLEGAAAATGQDNIGEVLITTAYEIAESATIDRGKIRIALHPVTVTK